ncbi:hypothetical protein OV450_3480 [Actinobacteria bacterium OV450]|nr:hypothetical protein OV450_3480 [Actinobacteria bacterium OV450]
MTSATADEGQPVHRRKTTVWLSKVFALDRAGVNWPRAVVFLDVGLVPLVVFWAIGHEEYLLSALFGLLFAALADPGGGYGHRASHVALFALIGAGVTLLAFGVGAQAWGWLVLVAFVVTLAAGLAAAFGVRRFVNALLLNIWFIVAVGLAYTFHHATHVTSHTWAQALAWAGGSALWIALTFTEWLFRGRRDLPQPVAELPGDTSRRKLTGPLTAFAVIRALAVGGSVALAFGLELPHGYWIPIAAIVAIKPSLEQSTLVAAQRLAGSLIGALAASLLLLLLLPAGETGLKEFAMKRGLEVVALVLLMHGVGIRFLNYALYTPVPGFGVPAFPAPSDGAHDELQGQAEDDQVGEHLHGDHQARAIGLRRDVAESDGGEHGDREVQAGGTGAGTCRRLGGPPGRPRSWRPTQLRPWPGTGSPVRPRALGRAPDRSSVCVACLAVNAVRCAQVHLPAGIPGSGTAEPSRVGNARCGGLCAVTSKSPGSQRTAGQRTLPLGFRWVGGSCGAGIGGPS